MVNDGHLRMMNTDMTGMREAFGGEDGGNGGTNSYLKARYVQTTKIADRRAARSRELPDGRRSPPRATARCRRASCSSSI